MIDKAFGMREVADQMTKEPMVNMASALILSADTEEEKMYAINLFGSTLVGLMAHAMSELLLSAEDFSALTKTIEELNKMGQEQD